MAVLPSILRAVHEAACLHQAVDVGLQFLVEGSVVGAVDGHRRTARPALDGGEADAAHGAVGHHAAEVVAALLRGAAGVPVEAHFHRLRDALHAHAVLAVVAQVEGQLHDAEVLVGLALEGVEEVQLVHLGVEEVVLRLLHAQYEGRVGHVDVHLLYHQALGSLPLVLVRAFAVALVLPQPLPFSLLRVAQAYVGHDVVDGLRDALLAASGGCAEDVHQGGLVLRLASEQLHEFLGYGRVGDSVVLRRQILLVGVHLLAIALMASIVADMIISRMISASRLGILTAIATTLGITSCAAV